MAQRLSQAEGELRELILGESRLEKELEERRTAETKASSAYSRNELAVDALTQQIDWHNDQVSRLKGVVKQSSDEEAEITASLSIVEAQINQAREDVRRQEHLTQALTLDEFQSQAAFWNTQSAVAERALRDARSRRDERGSTLEQAKNAIEMEQNHLHLLEASLKALEVERAGHKQSEAEVSAQIETLRLLVDPAEAELDRAAHLAGILAPRVAQFQPDCVVVGGNIARSWPLFGPRLQAALAPLACRPSALFEDAALLGAAAISEG